MLYIYTDGACKGNPGKAGYGCAAYADVSGEPVWTLSEYIGHSTNNIAEYSAIKFALLKSASADDITIYSDSNLAVQQLNGKWKVKNKSIKVYYDEIKKIIKDNELNCTFIHVRAHCGIPGNEMADRLANEAISKQNLP